MNAFVQRKRLFISYAGLYMAFAATAARAIFTLHDSPNVGLMVGLLSIYLLLLVVEPRIIARNTAYLHLINALQTAIALVLLIFIENFDFFSLLFIPPCAISVMTFRRRTALIWIAVICLLMEAALLAQFPLQESIGYAIIYPAGIFLFTGLSYMALQAEEAKNISEALLVDLQTANRKLQVYSEQVRELAAANERNRLARELHDSVTQIVFGLTLTAQAARILLDRDPSRVAAQLDHMQVLAQNALAEMRALIQQLHPRSVAEEGLIPAVRRLASEHQVNNGLTVQLLVSGERRLPVNVEEELYRVVQEALNNIVKHACTNQAEVTVDLNGDTRVYVSIKDQGAGFDPSRVHTLPGHLGLVSMGERVQALGGKLKIDSSPGKGTSLRAEINLPQEVEHD